MILGVQETSFWECFPDVFWEPNSEASGSHGGEEVSTKVPWPLASFNIDMVSYTTIYVMQNNKR